MTVTYNMLKIIEIKTTEDRAKPMEFLQKNDAPFLQSMEWGEFQAAVSRKVWTLIVLDESAICAGIQIVKHDLPFGKCYLYCPKGPVIELKTQNSQLKATAQSSKLIEILKLFINHLKKLIEKENAIFLRIEPEFLQNNQEQLQILKNLGFKKSSHELQPKDTLILNLEKSEQEILAQMHQKTRYNIRLAEKRGVKVRQSADLKDLEIFYSILQKTAKRDKFFTHTKEYYQKQLEILGPKDLVRLFLAEYQGKLIAGILVSFYNKRAVYLHGAQDFEFRNLMAPHLLQWRAILEAKRRGCTTYDFWGIAASDVPANHSWQGITRFKRGFGGREINYVGAWDLVFSKIWYWGYKLAHRFTRT